MNIDKMIIQSVNNINLMIDKEQMLNNIKLMEEVKSWISV